MADGTILAQPGPAAIQLWVRGAVAALAGHGVGLPAAKRISPAAQLRRLGFTVPDYDELQQGIARQWGVEIVISTNARVQEIAEAILAATTRRKLMTTRDQILQGAREIVATEAGLKNTAQLTADTRLHHDLDGLPVCLARIWAGLEGRFGVLFTLTELMVHGHRDGLTIGDLVEAVAGKLEQAEPSEVAA